MAQIKKLKLNGKTIYPVTHPKAVIDPSSGRNIAAAATQSANGLMSAADKKKLDSFSAETNYVKTSGNQTISGEKTFNQFNVPERSNYYSGFVHTNVGIQYNSMKALSNTDAFNAFLGMHTKKSDGLLYIGTSGNHAGFYYIEGTSGGSHPTVAILGIDSNNGSWYMSGKKTDPLFYLDGAIRVTTLTQSSDIRLKDDVKDVGFEEIRKATEIKLKSFTFKDDEKKKLHYGYIAQEVEQAIPDVVSKDAPSDDNPDPMRGLNYIELLALKTAYLEKKNADLEARIQKLESLVAKLPQSETEV